jgi:uncharacterized protein YjhX (UPF0386 family)
MRGSDERPDTCECPAMQQGAARGRTELGRRRDGAGPARLATNSPLRGLARRVNRRIEKRPTCHGDALWLGEAPDDNRESRRSRPNPELRDCPSGGNCLFRRNQSGRIARMACLAGDDVDHADLVAPPSLRFVERSISKTQPFGLSRHGLAVGIQ